MHFNEIQVCPPMVQEKEAITPQTCSTSLLLSPSECSLPLGCTGKSCQGSILQSYRRGDVFFTCTVLALMVAKYFASWEIAIALTPSSG